MNDECYKNPLIYNNSIKKYVRFNYVRKEEYEGKACFYLLCNKTRNFDLVTLNFNLINRNRD